MPKSTTPRPVHFEIYADDTGRVSKFYTDVFGWKIEKWADPTASGDYWMVMTGEKGTMGIDGGIDKRQKAPANGGANAFVCTIGVPDFYEYQEKILSAGGTVERAKYEIPKVGTHGYFRDTEGNIFAILQPSAEMMEM